MIQSFSAEIIIIANFLVLTANIVLTVGLELEPETI